MTWRLIRRFPAYDEDGKEYMVNVYEQIIDAPTLENPNQTIKGDLKKLMTDERDYLNLISKGEYKIVASGITITSDHPDAV